MIGKKGADKFLSVYWFFILFLVAGAVVYMIAAFYGRPYDVREVESQILIDRVSQCVVSNGYITNLQDFTNDNILQKCSLNFNTESTDNWNNDQYYIKIDVIDFNSNNIINTLSAGNSNLADFCISNNKNINLPFCLTRSVYALDNQNNQYLINITSIVRKTEKNVQ